MANQRGRLYGAMIEATAAHGYAGTSVAELCRLAGISKRTFYEQFENKQACFDASCERVVEIAARRLSAAWSRRVGSRAQLADALEVLMREVKDQPKAARLILLEARPGGASPWSGAQGPRLGLERAIAEAFMREQFAPGFARLLATAVVHGIERVSCQTLLEERIDDPARLAAGLTDWTQAYCISSLAGVAGAASLAMRSPPVLGPAERSRTPGPRARVLRAAAEIAAAEGLEHLTFARIARRTGQDEEALAGAYGSVDVCFREAVELLGLDALMRALEASRSAGGGLRGACLGVIALVERAGCDALLFEIMFRTPQLGCLEASQPAGRLLRGVLEGLLTSLPADEHQSWVRLEATIGALWGAIRDSLSPGGGPVSPALGIWIAYVALAPLVDPGELAVALTELLGSAAASDIERASRVV